jgi:SAM-dependent methyltransferase
MDTSTTRHCAICGPEARSRVKFPANLPGGRIDFAARKTPQHHHFQVNECLSCGLIYSSPIFPADQIEHLYRESRFISEPQLDNMLADYVDLLKGCLKQSRQADSLLEIGCSSGFFLKAASALGIREIAGVEPGEEACRQADPAVRNHIHHAFFTESLFPENHFDIVCCFQVLDHLLDPLDTLRNIFRVLKPGGLFLTVNHNIRSWMPRLLGEKCPMYDIEHIYLFAPSTMKLILEKAGFEILMNRNITNSYTLGYAAKMLPLPERVRGWFMAMGADHSTVRLPAGNMAAVASKPR